MSGKHGGDGGGDSFLERWSRRKRDPALQESEQVDPAGAVALEPEAGLPDENAETEAETLERLGLQNPETLAAGDDFTGFMRRGVPEQLRRRALRKLWLTNPELANLDGLVDYGGDFTDKATVIANMQTIYQVGKGMLSAFDEPEKNADDAEALDDNADTLPDVHAPGGQIESDTVAEAVDADPGAESANPQAHDVTEKSGTGKTPVAVAAGPVQTPSQAPAAQRRTMRFRFERDG